MEKERSSKLLAIIALVVAVCGLSFGFAAFTKDLNITFSESNVKVNGDLDVKLYGHDKENGGVDYNSRTVVPYLISDGVEVTPLTISEDRTSISVGSVNFNSSGLLVEYLIVLFNHSEYDAYFKKIEFLNYGETGEFKVCTALPGTSQDLVDQACDNIHVYLSLANGNVTIDSSNVDKYDFDVIKEYIDNGEFLPILLSIVYDEDAVVPNGDFKINFGGIKFKFSSLSE